MDDATMAAKVDELHRGWRRAIRAWIDHPAVQPYVEVAKPVAIGCLAPFDPYMTDYQDALVLCAVGAGGLGTVQVDTGEVSRPPAVALGITADDIPACSQASYTFGLIVGVVADALNLKGAAMDPVNPGDLYAVAQLLLLADLDQANAEELVASLDPATNSVYLEEFRSVEHRDGLPVEMRRTADELRDQLRKDLAGSGPALARSLKQGRPAGSGDVDLIGVLRNIRTDHEQAPLAEFLQPTSSVGKAFEKAAGRLPGRSWLYLHWREAGPGSSA